MMLLPLILAIHAPASDGDLIARLQRRDPQALAELYDRYGRIAYSLILRIVRDSGIADDAQDERISDAAVAIVQFGEGLRVAALEARDEIAVGGGSVNREDERQEHHNASI